MAKNRRFKGGEIPTSSMADIAFLLLIFFLVTTTIDTDKGLGIVLPPPGDIEIEIRKENILNCLINSQGKVLLDEEPISVAQIHRVVGQKMRKNDKLIISVKAHPNTAYNDYVRVIDQLKMADAKRISTVQLWVSKEGLISIDDRLLGVDDVSLVMYDKRVADPQIVVSLKGDEEAEMGLISDIHDNLRKVEALKLNYSTKTLVD